jgi:hypothetical protein
MKKIATAVVAALLVPAAGPAQERTRPPSPSQGLNGKTMESCRIDIQRLCSKVGLNKECLVANWTKISSDCQDALASPMRSSGGGGG